MRVGKHQQMFAEHRIACLMRKRRLEKYQVISIRNLKENNRHAQIRNFIGISLEPLAGLNEDLSKLVISFLYSHKGSKNV